MAEDLSAVVIDNGSGMIKAGTADNDLPTAIFPSIIGRARYTKLSGLEDTMEYIGDDATQKRGVLNLSYPVEHGVITNWDDMTKIWDYMYSSHLRCETDAAGVHLTEAPRNPTTNREQMLQIFFERFQVPQFYVSIQAVLALYASGRTTGIVFDAGDGVTHMVPVVQGFSLKHAIQRINLAGRDLTQQMMDILQEANVKMSGTAEFRIVEAIKEKLCYVAQDFDEEMTSFKSGTEKDKTYELPDGQIITIGDQQIRCPETLFRPQVLGMDFEGVHHSIYNCIQKCDIDVRRDLYEGIVLSGGSTMFPGIAERITKEVSALAPASVHVKVSAAQDRKFTVWIGGGILSNMATFQNMWVNRDEYDECGASVVHRKCF